MNSNMLMWMVLLWFPLEWIQWINKKWIVMYMMNYFFYGCRLMQMSAITSLISTWTIRSNHNMRSGLISMLCIRRIIWILRILNTLFARSLFLSRNIKSSWSGSIIWLLDMKREMSSRTQRILFCYRKKSYMKDIKLILMKNYKSIFHFCFAFEQKQHTQHIILIVCSFLARMLWCLPQNRNHKPTQFINWNALYFEDIGLTVFVDGHDHFAFLYASQMLSCSTHSQSQIDGRRNILSCLSNLICVFNVLVVYRSSCSTHYIYHIHF